MDNESNLEKVSFPTNNISKVYILSALYKFDPSLLVMILLMEDLTKFFQFISLFENKSINVPKISDVYSLFEECKLLMSNFEDDSLSIRDRESLALLSTDCNNISDLSADSKLNPYLEVFFEESVKKTMSIYTELQESLIKKADSGADINKIEKLYTRISSELSSQIKLMKEIVTSISSVKEIELLVNSLIAD
jgi:hypothetical protein